MILSQSFEVIETAPKKGSIWEGKINSWSKIIRIQLQRIRQKFRDDSGKICYRFVEIPVPTIGTTVYMNKTYADSLCNNLNNNPPNCFV